MAKFIVACSSPEAEVLLKKRPDISAFVKRLRRLAEENPDATSLIMTGNRFQIKRKLLENIIDSLGCYPIAELY